MELTADQRVVVEIDTGEHLVLAPPGSGKTEMLTQRIVRALRRGVPPARMLCATFTNRAAAEMKERVTAEGSGLVLPDIGNLHHFCERFLRSAGLLHPGKRVIDEVEQEDLVHEVFDVLCAELRAGKPADVKRTHGVTVLAHLGGTEPDLIVKMREDMETHLARCRRNLADPAAGAREGMVVIHQRRIGLPRKLVLPWPRTAGTLDAIGALGPMEKAYRALKRRFQAVDFDDLLNETYLQLTREPLDEEDRFSWVQVDEVQDLNPLQWAIIRELTAQEAVRVYFGDVEQSIYSFMGASLDRLQEMTRTCERHAFRTNFRATPLLLEILMRFSLDQLQSDRTFISAPSDVDRANGEARHFPRADGVVILREIDRLLRTGTAHEVAVLVRTNREADAFESGVAQLGWRSVKVSGFELGCYRPMRDFLSFVDLFAAAPSRIAWIALVRRFGTGISNRRQARYFVRGMLATGWNPQNLLAAADAVPRFPPVRGRANIWAWRHRVILRALRSILHQMYTTVEARLSARGTFATLFEVFADTALTGTAVRYRVSDLLPEEGVKAWPECQIPYAEACRKARKRMIKFVRYVDDRLNRDGRTLKEFLQQEWNALRRLKESDMLIGDERIIISTVHKAKGRQFDAVVVPNVDAYFRETGEVGETARQLYVAMSRAKRHLIVFGEGEKLPPGIAPCFRRGYVGYYRRKAAGDDLSDDWLAQWEELAALNERQQYQFEPVRRGLHSCWPPVVRMAFRVLRYHPDAEARKDLLLSALTEERMKPVRATIIDCLRSVRVFDRTALAAVQACCLGSVAVRVWSATLVYYLAALQQADGALSTGIRAQLEDGLYAPDKTIRLCTAEELDARYGTHWQQIVHGTHGDYKRLGEIPAPDHERTIRQILKTDGLPPSVAEGLRSVLFMRSRCL